jgi:hypothetical protein
MFRAYNEKMQNVAPPRGRPAARGLTLGACLGLLLRPVPLVGTPSYEFALAVGVVLFVLGLVLGVRDGRRLGPVYAGYAARPHGPAGGPWRESAARSLLVLTAAAAAAFAVAVLFETLFTHCQWERGLGVYLLVVFPLLPQAWALGLLAGTSRRPHLALVLLLGAYLALSLGLTAYEGLAGPRAVLHNLTLGVVSASGYAGHGGGSLPLGLTAISGRLVGLVLAVALLALTVRRAASHAAHGPDTTALAEARLSAHARLAGRVAAGAGVVLAVMALQPDRFGLGSGRTVLEDTLSGRAETANFVLRYRPGSRVERHLEEVAEAHEWALKRVSDVLDIQAPQRAVVSYVYADDDDLERVTGARGFLFAKPWLGEMHVRYVDGWGAPRLNALAHELAHVLAARFGLPGLRISARYGLVEGFAEAAADGFGEHTEAHAPVAAAFRRGLLPPAETVVSTLGFATRSAAGSYRAAGSFCGWLLMEYGPQKLTRVYARGDFESVYGRSLETLDRQWRRFLAAVPADEQDVKNGVAVFTAPPFYGSRCPRLGSRPPRSPSLPPDPCRADPAGSASSQLAAAQCLLEEGRQQEALEVLERVQAVASDGWRDRALGQLVRQAALRHHPEQARMWLEARRRLGQASSYSLALQAMALERPDLNRPAPRLNQQRRRGDPPADWQQALLTTYELLQANAGWSDRLDEASGWLGGCDQAVADLEAVVLLGAARAARHAGLAERAGELLDNASSVARDPSLVRRLDRERQRWRWAAAEGPFLKPRPDPPATGT